MAGLLVAPPRIRSIIARSRAFAVLPFVRPALKWRRLPRTYGTGSTASARWFALLRVTFLILVVVPTIVAALYSAFVRTPVYQSQARIAIRESLGERNLKELDENSGSSSGAAGIMNSLSHLLGNVPSTAHTQAPFLLSNYAMSLDYVSQIDKDGWLRHFFTGPGIDPLSALRPDATIEQLQRFWNRHLTIAVDSRSEILLLNMRAFSPRDAQILAERVLKDGERLLNEVMVRARSDSIRDAREQLARAQEAFTLALQRQQEWRERRRAVDPAQAADALGITLLRLEQERISADRDIRALKNLGAGQSPTIEVLHDRIQALDGEIARFKARLAEAGSKNSAAEALAAFEESELEVRFAETLQSVAFAGLQEAERRAQAQSAFVNVFVPPSLPTSPSGPFWWQTTIFVFTAALILWINVMIAIAVIRDHRR